MGTKLNVMEDFLATKWQMLPSWARVVSYFILLFAYVYLLITPQFIYGECYIKDEDGGLSAYRNNFVHVNIDGHTIKQKINEDGVWVIPLVSKIPQSVTVHFWYNDKEYPIDISASKILFGKTVKVYVEEKPVRFYIDKDSVHKASMVSLLNGRSSFDLLKDLWNQFAGVFMEEPAAQGNQIADSIESKIKVVVGNTLQVDTALIHDNSPVKKGDNASSIQNIKIQNKLEKKFNVRIPDEAWDTLKTVSKVKQFIEKQIERGKFLTK
jgi:acyl carrier protein